MALPLAACARATLLCRGARCARRAAPAARASARALRQRVPPRAVVCRAAPAAPPARPLAAASAPPAAADGVVATASGEDADGGAGFALSLLSAAVALSAGPASAAYTPAVDADAVSSVAQNAIGVLFTIAFAAFLLRVLRKRASRALNVRVAAERKAVDAPPAAELPPVTAVACFQGAVLAVLCAAALWTFTQFVEGAFDSAAPSDQYAVRNVTGTLRSIVTGLGYLATFLFGANAIGLSGLGLQIATGGQQAAEEKAADDDRAP